MANATTMKLLRGDFDFSTRLTTWEMLDEQNRRWQITGESFRFEGVRSIPPAYEYNAIQDSHRLVEAAKVIVPRDGIIAPGAVFKQIAEAA